MKQDKMIPGGNSLKFNTSLLMMLEAKSVLKEEEWGFNGQLIKMKAVKNKSFAPNILVDFVASYTKGFHNLFTNFLFLKDQKKFKTGGAWYTFKVDEVEYKFMRKQLEQKIKEDPIFKKAFLKYTKLCMKEFKDSNTYSNEDDILDFDTI
jgi:hypothetical protein